MNSCILHLKWHRAPQLYHLKSEVSTTLCCQLCSTRYTAVRIKSCSKSISATHAYRKKELVLYTRPSNINYCLKSEVTITFHCWLCSTHYTTVRIKNYFKNTSAIKVATIKKRNDFHYEGKPSRVTTKLTLFAASKDE